MAYTQNGAVALIPQPVNILLVLINIVYGFCHSNGVSVLIPPSRSISCPRRLISFKTFVA